MTTIGARILRLLPPSWFSGRLHAALAAGAGNALTMARDAISEARRQARIATASGAWLDIIAHDFFGHALRRRQMPDDALRAAIIARFGRERSTLRGLAAAVGDAGASVIRIIEPGVPSLSTSYGAGGHAYGVGLYGSTVSPMQVFLQVRRGGEQPESWAWGYGSGGYGDGHMTYAPVGAGGASSDADIYAEVAAAKAAGVVAWVNIR